MFLEELPNELIIECLKYLNGFDIFYSFNQLNTRFQSLIRDLPLSINFCNVNKVKFDDFCCLLSSNPEIQQQIRSLHLSNEDFCQIYLFLSKFSFNEFSNLQSLTLFHVAPHNQSQLSIQLPFLSQLSCFRLTMPKNSNYCIRVPLAIKQLRILMIADVFDSIQYLYHISSLEYLTILSCDSLKLTNILNNIPKLKYLNINYFYRTGSPMNIADEYSRKFEKAIHLKRLIIKNYTDYLSKLEWIFMQTPNLESLTLTIIQIEVIDANQWQEWILYILQQLRTFQFCFHFRDEEIIKNIDTLFKQFQNDFWLKQHQWYTEYIVLEGVGFMYTIPYSLNIYTVDEYISNYNYPLTTSPNKYDNVTDLTISTNTSMNQNQFYFSNIRSLTFSYGSPVPTSVDSLRDLTNLTHIKELKFNSKDHIDPLFLLHLLKQAPNISSLSIYVKLLLLLLNNDELCFYLNKMIKKLTFLGSFNIDPNEDLSKIWQTFSNIEYIHYEVQHQDFLITIIPLLPKLLRIDIPSSSSDLKLDLLSQLGVQIMVDERKSKLSYIPRILWIIR